MNQQSGPNPSRSQALYESLFELMPGSVILMDDKGVVLDANPSFCRQIGYAREELLGQHVSLFSTDSPEVIQQNLARLLASEVLQHDVSNRRRDGSLRHYELREKAIRLPDGSRGILALSNDITERVRAQEEKLALQRQFLHAEKLKSLGLMAGGIAHDFNNLLAAILGNIELSLMELDGHPAVKESLRMARAAANRAADLTRQMLTYSGHGQFVVTDLNLNEVIQDTTELLKATTAKQTRLEFRLDKTLPPVKSDAAQLQQILVSLVTNASEALGDHPGLVTIATSVRECDAAYLASNRSGDVLRPGRYVMLEVSDTGCGMNESVQEHLFDPFFSTKFTGRGLGLSAVLGAVRGHNGGVAVSSQVGRGTTMTVLFPAGSARTPDTPLLRGTKKVVDLEALPKLTGTVLVVDDEDLIRAMAESLLKRTGLRVLLAADGMEAVDVFKQNAQDITFVLMDLTLPKMDGVKTLAELRRHDPQVKAVLTSGYNEASTAALSAQAGFVAFIPKPYKMEELIELAWRICSGEH